MIEIRLHGRGGQGVVTGAELIAISAFYDGKYSQAFPYFGVERRGAPIEAYVRIDNKFINLREQIKEPDIIIVQDATLLSNKPDILDGLKNSGMVIINTGKDLKELFGGFGEIEENNNGDTFLIFGQKKRVGIKKINGTDLAFKVLRKPIVNTLMTAFLANVASIINIKSVRKALKEKFSGELLEKNLKLIDRV